MAVGGEDPTAGRTPPRPPRPRIGLDPRPRVLAALALGAVALAAAAVGGFALAVLWWMASVVSLGSGSAS